MDKTIVVAAKFKEKHPIYGKFVSRRRRNTMLMTRRMTAHVGDTVYDYGDSSFEQDEDLES